MDRLAIKNAGSLIFLSAGDIDWIEAADYYASLHVGKKTHLLRRGMNDLESDLDPAQFCRIHRSTIVNLDRVRELGVSTATPNTNLSSPTELNSASAGGIEKACRRGWEGGQYARPLN